MGNSASSTALSHSIWICFHKHAGERCLDYSLRAAFFLAKCIFCNLYRLVTLCCGLCYNSIGVSDDITWHPGSQS